MAMNDKVMKLLSELFLSLLDDKNPHKLQSGVHDIFVRIDLERGEVALIGEDEEVLASCVIFSWVTPDESKPTYGMVTALKEVVVSLEQKGYWENPVFEHPFSIVLIDGMFETIDSLLYLNDDTIQASNILLEGLERELDEFIINLLGDLK